MPLALTFKRIALAGCAAIALNACSAVDRMKQIGETPQLTPIENPTAQPGYRPVSLPMPAPVVADPLPNSLWKPGAKAFFKDQRASEVGDLITVVVTIDDDAELDNASTRTRDNSNTLDFIGFFGLEQQLADIFNDGTDGEDLVGLGSTLSNGGTGTIDREEEINLKLSAVIVQKLPNGNMVIYGRQETRVNFEVRELLIAGVIRPQDISTENTIAYEDIAEARMAYGGRGQLTDVQQPRYGDQALDILLPF